MKRKSRVPKVSAVGAGGMRIRINSIDAQYFWGYDYEYHDDDDRDDGHGDDDGWKVFFSLIFGLYSSGI
jgi:hypothetical protein